MLAGAKGRELVAAMPNGKVLLETDGPFAQVRRQGLNPWDITAALRPIAALWGVTEREAQRRIEVNERALLASVAAALGRPTT